LQETCNHRDDDCDEAVDNLPGCPPGTFLGADPADAGFTTGALRTATAVATTTTCSRDLTGNLTEIFDGGRWVGSESGSNHILYAEVNDGGSWNLSMPGAALRLRFGGTLTNVEPANPFAWFQPQVVLCGPNQTVQRLDPDSQFVRVTQDGGWSLDVNVVVPFDGSGNYHSGNTPGPFFRLSEIGRVEVLIAPAAHTPPPAFDINVTQFDVIWP